MSDDAGNAAQYFTDGKLDATLIADAVAHEPTTLARGADGDVYEYRDGIFVRDENAVKKRCAAALGARYSNTVLGQVEAHLLNIDLPIVALPRLPRGYLDYVVVENGVYWWRDDQLDNHSPALGALTKLHVTHDPVAIPHAFNEWLEQVLPDEDVRRHLWEMIGYLLMTGNPLQKIFMLYGEGGNGKGTLMRVIRDMLGDENYSSISLHQLVDDRFATSGLYGRIANLSGDLSAKFLADPQILKEITGGDSINASRKFGQSFEFVPYAVPLFSANEYFRTSDNSVGWRRRWEVVEFTQRVDGLPGFDEQNLLDDGAGIFNLAMDGLRRLMDRGRFAPPQAAQDATKRLHDEADPFMKWLDEDDGIYLGELQTDACELVYGRYKRWCSRNGYNPVASGPFGRRLLTIDGITRTRRRDGSARTYYYEGIGVAQTIGDEG
ncbi:DNA primase family protein [Microbacterium sp.]|uniref:DNA primase family protein n=1 Tax=Microbacterium sp. TaxID=51671 RepID=UPI003A8CD574